VNGRPTKLSSAPGFQVPPRPQDELCGDRHDDVTAIVCERAVGHPGDHQGYAIVTWPQEGA
jgi:hypothetical protein